MLDPSDALRMPFLALLSASGAVGDRTGYTWTEQAWDSSATALYTPDSPRTGTLTAFEINDALIELPTYARLFFRSLDADGTPLYDFELASGAGSEGGSGGDGSDPDGLPLCVIDDEKLECVLGTLYRFTRRIYLTRGCLEATPWALDGPVGDCINDPPEGEPPCLAVVPDFRCIWVGTGTSAQFLQARFEKRIYIKDGCVQETPLVYAGLTGICCDCPDEEECEACEPCSSGGTVATACCPAVPCELCLKLEGPGACVPINITLTYVPDDPIEACVCGWASEPFYLGSCELTAALACLPAKGMVPARWVLRIRDANGLLGLDQQITLISVSCGPPLELFGLFAFAAGGTCCGDEPAFVAATITPAPCPAPCVPAGACASCPDGAPRGFSADLTFLDGVFADFAGTHTLLWQGGCTWSVTTPDGFEARLYYSAGWLFRLTAPDGTYYQADPGAGCVLDASAFNCCEGGTFTGDCGDDPDFERNNWELDDVALTPVPEGCCGGSGSDPGSDPGDECCDEALPETLYAHFTGGTGTCTCLNGLSVEILYDLVDDHWAGTINGLALCGTIPVDVLLTCFPPWGLLIGGTEASATSSSCDPVALVFTVSFPPLGAICSGTVTVTITDVP